MQEREQALQVIAVRAQRVRRRPAITLMLQKPARYLDRPTVLVEQPNLPDNAAVADLDNAHDIIVAPTSAFVGKARPT